MEKNKINKTNAMRLLDEKKIEYQIIDYTDKNYTNGVEIANYLNEDPSVVFKTLVTIGKSHNHYVFCIPVDKELDLKKAAKSVDEKNIEMVKSKELLGLTGYIHGGCSPVGMKKFFKTTFDISLLDKDYIYFSGGKIGYQVKVKVEDIKKVIDFQTFNLI